MNFTRCSVIVLLAVVSTPAGQNRATAESTGGPYCGIYSVYAALRAEGMSVPFETLVEKQYLGSEEGSRLAELVQAARDSGAHAEPVHDLTAGSLRAARHPIVLHVRRPGKGTSYHHWVVFLGVDGDGQARVLDPPNHAETISFAQLLALWDGVGLVVARDDDATSALQCAAWVEKGLALAFVVVGLIIVRLLTSSPRRIAPSGSWLVAIRRRLLATVGLAALALGLAVVWHCAEPEGFFGNAPAVGQVMARHFTPDLPELQLAEVEALVGSDDATIIDARFPDAYKAGHLPHAINVCVATGLAERDQILKTVKPTNRLIVYCQSDRCTWAESVASDLVYRGFSNVALYRGGWIEWESHAQAK